MINISDGIIYFIRNKKKKWIEIKEIIKYMSRFLFRTI